MFRCHIGGFVNINVGPNDNVNVNIRPNDNVNLNVNVNVRPNLDVWMNERSSMFDNEDTSNYEDNCLDKQ